MKAPTHQVLKDSTEEVKAFPPGLGAPTAVQLRVHTPSTPLPDAWENATVDSTDVVTSAASEEGADTLTFASDPGLTPFDKYLVLSDQGPQTVVPLNTGTTVYLRTPLEAAVASGDAVKGLALTHALTAEETESTGFGFVLWKATVDGEVREWTEYLEVVLRRLRCPVTPEDVTAAWPTFPEWLQPEDPTGALAVEAAWKYEVLAELRKRNVHEELVVNPDPLADPTIEAVRYRLTREKYPTDEVAQNLALESLQRAYRRSFASADWYQAEDHTETQPDKDESKRPVRRVRLTR